MLKLEEIQKSAAIAGIEPGQVVRIVTTELVRSCALTAFSKTTDRELYVRMRFRADQPLGYVLADATGQPNNGERK